MKRLFAIILTAAALSAPLPVLADPPAEIGRAVAAQLRDQGYGQIEVARTWLGRVRVVGLRGAIRREIVVNPNTGEILRDYQSGSTRIASGGRDGARGTGAATSDPGPAVGVATSSGDPSAPDLIDGGAVEVTTLDGVEAE